MNNQSAGFIQRMNCYSRLRLLQKESVSHRHRVAVLQHRISLMLGTLGNLKRYRQLVLTLTGVKLSPTDTRKDNAQSCEKLMCLGRTLEVIIDQSNSSTRLLRSTIALLITLNTEDANWENRNEMIVAIDTSFRGSSHLLTRLEATVALIGFSVSMSEELR